MHYFRICVFISLRVQLVFVILFDSLFLSSECIYNTYSLKIWLNLKYVDLKLWSQKAIVKCDFDLKQLFLLKRNFQCYTRYHNIVETINILRDMVLLCKSFYLLTNTSFDIKERTIKRFCMVLSHLRIINHGS